MSDKQTDYIIYTDGGCDFNPGGIGAYAAIITNTHTQDSFEVVGAQEPTTNNRMEMMAVIEALERLPDTASATIYSDSQYFINTATGKWHGDKNPDLWERYWRTAKTHKLSFVWVRGHNGNQMNERCDQLCTQAMQSMLPVRDEGYIQSLNKRPSRQAQQAPKKGAMGMPIDIPEFYEPTADITIDSSMPYANAVATLNNKKAPSFKDYARLKVGGKDKWTTTKESTLIELFGQEVYDTVLENLKQNKTAAVSALRWMARGLTIEHAIRKAMVDNEINENALRSNKGPGSRYRY